jgi:hypothetical protein
MMIEAQEKQVVGRFNYHGLRPRIGQEITVEFSFETVFFLQITCIPATRAFARTTAPGGLAANQSYQARCFDALHGGGKPKCPIELQTGRAKELGKFTHGPPSRSSACPKANIVVSSSRPVDETSCNARPDHTFGSNP